MMSKAKRKIGASKRRTSAQKVIESATAKHPSGPKGISVTEAGGKSGSKQNRVLALLQRNDGVTIETLMQVTGWQQHTVRGFFAGVVRKKLGLDLTSVKTDAGRVYRLPNGEKSNAARAPKEIRGAKGTNPVKKVAKLDDARKPARAAREQRSRR